MQAHAKLAGMSLKTRLALVVVLLMTVFAATYSWASFAEVSERAEAETQGTLPLVMALLPGRVDAAAHGDAQALQSLVDLLSGLGRIRHASIALFDPQGRLLAATPAPQRPLPGWLRDRLAPHKPARKNVVDGERIVAYFMVAPAIEDEWAELWGDFVRSSMLIGGLSVMAVVLIVLSAWFALRPIDRILSALRAVGSGHPDARLPHFRSPEMDEIAKSFNRMANALEAAQAERTALMRRLLESEEQTRRTLAHDLHDELSPYLVALQPLSRVLEQRCAALPGLADLSESVQRLVAHQAHILATLRKILTGLHPPELSTLGLHGALAQLVKRRTDDSPRPVVIHLQLSGNLHNLGATLDVSIYRMVQECLTNALRHSQCARINIAIDGRDAEPGGGGRRVDIEVSNDGTANHGTGAAAGLGILGMRERSIALGGSFESAPAGPGWRVRIHLPVNDLAATPEPFRIPAHKTAGPPQGRIPDGEAGRVVQ
jgi:two-component system, NarL family, sensor histidine kinase UhpB